MAVEWWPTGTVNFYSVLILTYDETDFQSTIWFSCLFNTSQFQFRNIKQIRECRRHSNNRHLERFAKLKIQSIFSFIYLAYCDVKILFFLYLGNFPFFIRRAIMQRYWEIYMPSSCPKYNGNTNKNANCSKTCGMFYSFKCFFFYLKWNFQKFHQAKMRRWEILRRGNISILISYRWPCSST